MAIFVPSTSPARQVAELGEAEIHLLAVYPEARCQGIASRLIKACEEQAVSFGYSKMVLSTQQTMKKLNVSTSNSITDEILHEIGQSVKARSALFMKRSFKLN
jgi:GNAT superfamily N-acetyltransferase